MFLFLGLLIGTLGWDLLESIIAMAGGSLKLQAGPLGFDLGVVSFYLRINPGSLVGCAGGVLFFFRI